MSQIQSHCRADNASLCIKPGDPCPQPMGFQTYKSPNCQPNMIALRNFEPILTPFNSGKLFQSAMVDLNLPGIQGMEGGLLNGHVQAAGGPVFRVAVCADGPKHLDPPIPFEMYQSSLNGNKNLADRPAVSAGDIST